MTKQHGTRDPATRRAFLVGAGAGGALCLVGCGGRSQTTAHPASANGRDANESGEGGEAGEAGHAREAGEARETSERVSATEDLMKEHGVLRRILLVYEASRAQLTGVGDFHAPILRSAASIVHRFVEQYHEKLEEEHVFPRFERAGRHVALVATLRRQHDGGRDATRRILALTATETRSPTDPGALLHAIDAFIRMYRPHAAREDTVLFPALREVVSASELTDLGERFEEIEHQHFGEGGFDDIVSEVAELERALGIHELDQFTPRI